MMDVFDRSAATMNTVIDDSTISCVHHAQSLQDLAMARWFDADMATERAVTWERAALFRASKIGPDPYREGRSLIERHGGRPLEQCGQPRGAAQTPMMERFGAALAETVMTENGVGILRLGSAIRTSEARRQRARTWSWRSSPRVVGLR